MPYWLEDLIDKAKDALKFAAAATLAALYLIGVILGATALAVAHPQFWFLFLGGGIFLLAFGVFIAK